MDGCSTVTPGRHPWNKSLLVAMHNSARMLLTVICLCFFRYFCLCLFLRDKCLVLGLFLSFFGFGYQDNISFIKRTGLFSPLLLSGRDRVEFVFPGL